MDRPDPEAVAQEVFTALADPSRRGILAALAAGGAATATDLAPRLPITPQANPKHPPPPPSSLPARSTRRHLLSAHPAAPAQRPPRHRGDAVRRRTVAALRRLADHL